MGILARNRLNVIDDLGIKECKSDLDLQINSASSDPTDIAIMKYKNHRSIIMINGNVSFESQFRFRDINESNVQQEVLNLNSKKTSKKDFCGSITKCISNIPHKNVKKFS